jgi:hypothetical protein
MICDRVAGGGMIVDVFVTATVVDTSSLPCENASCSSVSGFGVTFLRFNNTACCCDDGFNIDGVVLLS